MERLMWIVSCVGVAVMACFITDIAIRKDKDIPSQETISRIKQHVKCQDEVGEILIKGLTAKYWENGKVIKVLKAEIATRKAQDGYFVVKNFELYEGNFLTREEKRVQWTRTSGKLAKVFFNSGDIKVIGKFKRSKVK